MATSNRSTNIALIVLHHRATADLKDQFNVVSSYNFIPRNKIHPVLRLAYDDILPMEVEGVG